VAAPVPDPLTLHPNAGPDCGAEGIVAPNMRRPLALSLLMACILAFTVYFVVTYVPALGNGSDFKVFYAAAIADKQGVNPFDWPSLWRVQQQVFNGGVGHNLPFAFAPYTDPPPFALLLRPFAGLPESGAYHLWAALLLGCGALGAYLALYDWPRRARLLAAALVTLSPAALFDLRLGQNSTPLLLALGASYRLTSLGRPFLAGLCLGCGLFKPHLMGPVAVIVILAGPNGSKRAMTAGFALAGGLAVLIGLWFDGGPRAYGHWLTALRQLGDNISLQPDLASVSGFYQGSAANGILNTVCLLGAAGIITKLAVRAHRSGVQGRQDLLGGGIAVYLALSPYVHTSDQILLAPALLTLIGPVGAGLRDQAVLLAAWVTVLAPMVVIRDYHTVGINALPPLTVALAYWLYRRRDARTLVDVYG
jgi:hypothetical protein